MDFIEADVCEPLAFDEVRFGSDLSMWTFLLKKALLGDLSLEEESFETAEVSARKRRRMSACLGMFR